MQRNAMTDASVQLQVKAQKPSILKSVQNTLDKVLDTCSLACPRRWKRALTASMQWMAWLYAGETCNESVFDAVRYLHTGASIWRGECATIVHARSQQGMNMFVGACALNDRNMPNMQHDLAVGCDRFGNSGGRSQHRHSSAA